MSLRGAFDRATADGRAAFVPFVMAGDPDLETTPLLLEALVAGGADVIELGVPFSDPVADGPVNQRAATRALAAGTSLSKVLAMIARCRGDLGVPIVLFTYFNPLHARGVGRFAEQAAASGVDGVLCVDLPPEEAAEEYAPALEEAGVEPVFLLSPTSSVERMRQAGRLSGGFVYYVSRTGVTGERALLPDGLERQVKQVRKKVDLPVAVGFGISSPEQVSAVASIADGVVVGSALVRLIEEGAGGDDLPRRLEERVRELAAATARESGGRRARRAAR